MPRSGRFGPNGPYVIAGYCAGGTIAFELARQLLRDGAEIRLLALFGSPFPTWYRLLPQLRELLGRTAERMVRHARALASLSLVQLRTYVAERFSNLKAGRAVDRSAAQDPVLVWRTSVGRATLAAIRRYSPGSFSGRLCLFWPRVKCGGNALAQWPSVAPQTRKYFGPDGCDGSNMLREPHAAAFAELFKSCTAREEPGEKVPLPRRSLNAVPARSGRPAELCTGSPGI